MKNNTTLPLSILKSTPYAPQKEPHNKSAPYAPQKEPHNKSAPYAQQKHSICTTKGAPQHLQLQHDCSVHKIPIIIKFLFYMPLLSCVIYIL